MKVNYIKEFMDSKKLKDGEWFEVNGSKVQFINERLRDINGTYCSSILIMLLQSKYDVCKLGEN